jgi:hypothetical protein
LGYLDQFKDKADIPTQFSLSDVRFWKYQLAETGTVSGVGTYQWTVPGNKIWVVTSITVTNDNRGATGAYIINTGRPNVHRGPDVQGIAAANRAAEVLNPSSPLILGNGALLDVFDRTAQAGDTTLCYIRYVETDWSLIK